MAHRNAPTHEASRSDAPSAASLHHGRQRQGADEAPHARPPPVAGDPRRPRRPHGRCHAPEPTRAAPLVALPTEDLRFLQAAQRLHANQATAELALERSRGQASAGRAPVPGSSPRPSSSGSAEAEMTAATSMAPNTTSTSWRSFTAAALHPRATGPPACGRRDSRPAPRGRSAAPAGESVSPDGHPAGEASRRRAATAHGQPAPAPGNGCRGRVGRGPRRRRVRLGRREMHSRDPAGTGNGSRRGLGKAYWYQSVRL